MNPLSPDELQEGRRLEAAATKGPWQLCGKDQTEVLALDGTPESIIVVDTRFFVEQTNPNEKEDAAFIAWMRNNAAALLDSAAQLSEAREADMVALDDSFKLFNGGQQCDALIGPCACGAWHTVKDFQARFIKLCKTMQDRIEYECGNFLAMNAAAEKAGEQRDEARAKLREAREALEACEKVFAEMDKVSCWDMGPPPYRTAQSLVEDSLATLAALEPKEGR